MQNTKIAIPVVPVARGGTLKILPPEGMTAQFEFVPFHTPNIGTEEIQSVVETLQSGWLTTGHKTKRFEADFAQYIGCQDAVAVNSGTAVLHLVLDAIGIQEGDEVIVPTMTFTATAEVVFSSNAKPVLVDCEPDKLNAVREIRR